jgi:hypothetical protein
MNDEREPRHEGGNAEMADHRPRDSVALEHEGRERAAGQLPNREELGDRPGLGARSSPSELGLERPHDVREVDARERGREC